MCSRSSLSALEIKHDGLETCVRQGLAPLPAWEMSFPRYFVFQPASFMQPARSDSIHRSNDQGIWIRLPAISPPRPTSVKPSATNSAAD